jgi:hypothetical protein
MLFCAKEEIIKMTINNKPLDPKVQKDLFIDTWMNNGFNQFEGKQYSFRDLMATSNAAVWMPEVVSTVLREPVEPLSVIPSLLDNIPYNGARQISLPAIGALVAYDIAEGESFPEQTLQMAPGSMIINMGKSGLSFKISEETQMYSEFDVINMHLRHGARALVRHKEKKGFDYLSAMGVTIFDNLSPTTSMLGTCTGRAIDGTGNGSCRMEDLVKAYAHLMMQGFIPNVLIMHPMTWTMWMVDPLLQSIVKNTGTGSWFQPTSPSKTGTQWESAALNKLGTGSGAMRYTSPGNAGSETPTAKSALDPSMNGRPNVPGYFPFPISVVVSPYAPYNPNNHTCNIILADSSNIGALITESGITTDRWDDNETDTLKIKMKERYCFAVYNEGLGIGVIRNVPIKANEIALPLSATISAAGSISELDTSTAISL